MKRRQMLKNIPLVLSALGFSRMVRAQNPAQLVKDKAEWKKLLSTNAYLVLFEHGTERAGTSPLNAEKRPGTFVCAACNLSLFDAAHKYESGTGWPSFTQPIRENAISYHKDRGFGMYRIETLCNTCDAHLGHVFQDGPLPSGLRYCINALALKKVEGK